MKARRRGDRAGELSAIAVAWNLDGAEALQLSIYCLAAEQLLLADRRAAPWCIGYWFVADKGFSKNQAMSLHEESSGQLRPTAGWEVLRRDVIARVFSLVEGIRRGQFPMFSGDPHCTSHCDFHTICRVNQARSLEKTWSPPAPGGWVAVAPADLAGPGRDIGPRIAGEPDSGIVKAWSPDGEAVLIRANDLQVFSVDVSSGVGSALTWKAEYLPDWQRTARP